MRKCIHSLASAFAALAFSLSAALAMAACSGDDPVAVTGVELSQKAISVPIGASVDLWADVKPPNASNKDVAWVSSANGVASVSGSGTVTGVSLGSATITVATKDGNFTDACAVTVTPEPVAVTGLAVSKKIAVAVGGTSLVSAEVLPHDATNKAVTWSYTPEGVVSVTATAYGAHVTGIAAGTATVTATTVEGNKTASCEVTVGQSLWADIYQVFGNGSLYVNGEPHPLGYEYYILAIQIDSAGVLHAAAIDARTGHAVYLRDGVPTVLPCAPDSVETDPFGLFVTLDGRAYVAYTDFTDDGGTIAATAMLWCDGQTIPLQGASDAFRTVAWAVHVADGNVYVVGGESNDGWSYSALVLWINGVKTSYPDCPAAGAAVAAIGDDIYVVAGRPDEWTLIVDGEMMMKIDATDPQRHEILGQYYDASNWEEDHHLKGMTASEGVLYACGYIHIFNDDRSQEWNAAYWANHVEMELECGGYDPFAGDWDGSAATCVCVPPSGAVYVSGAAYYDLGDGNWFRRAAMWKDGKYLGVLGRPMPTCLAVHEVVGVPASASR
jgi:hypothetical protein